MNQDELAEEIGALGEKALAAEHPKAEAILMTLAGVLHSGDDMILEMLSAQMEQLSRLHLRLIESERNKRL